MGRGPVFDAALRNRHRYIWEDPVRFGCVVVAGMLTFLPVIPFAVTLLIIAVLQLSAVALVTRFSLPGWSHQWGSRLHPAILATSMCMDWTNLCAGTIVGSMLLMRHFHGPESLAPLAILTAGVCLLPDVRLCRSLLASDPSRRSDHLRTGYFWRDPVKLGAMFAGGVVLWMNTEILSYVLLSWALFQFNVLLVFLDKYLSEIEVTQKRGIEALWTEREGRRLLACISPLGLIVARCFGGDSLALFGFVTLAGLIVVSDVLRYLLATAIALWKWMNRPRLTDPEPSTIIGIPSRAG